MCASLPTGSGCRCSRTWAPASRSIPSCASASSPSSNAGSQALVLTTDLLRALTRNVPAATLSAGQRVRFTGAQLGLTFAPQGELGLFDGQSVAGAIDVHFYGKLAAGRYEARSEGGD